MMGGGDRADRRGSSYEASSESVLVMRSIDGLNYKCGSDSHGS